MAIDDTKKYNKTFITPERFDEIKKRKLHGPNGWILFAACNQGIGLAERVKEEYDKLLEANGSKLEYTDDDGNKLVGLPFLNRDKNAPADGKITIEFEDGETCPRLPYHVCGSNVYVFQNVHELISGKTPNHNFMELIQMIYTIKAHGAKTITAVLPYLPGSRQDKPTTFKREGAIAKSNAISLKNAGANGILTYHIHTDAIHGFYEPEIKFTALNGLDLFIDIMYPEFHGRNDVVCCSTDAGSAKFTIEFAKALGVDYAIASKYRPREEKADLVGLIGKFKGKKVAIIGDDESVTVSSLFNVTKEVHDSKDINETHWLISHNKIREKHLDKVLEAREKYGLKKMHVTDSIPQTEMFSRLEEDNFLVVHPLAKRLAVVINRLHYNQSVSKIGYPRQRLDE